MIWGVAWRFSTSRMSHNTTHTAHAWKGSGVAKRYVPNHIRAPVATPSSTLSSALVAFLHHTPTHPLPSTIVLPDHECNTQFIIVWAGIYTPPIQKRPTIRQRGPLPLLVLVLLQAVGGGAVLGGAPGVLLDGLQEARVQSHLRACQVGAWVCGWLGGLTSTTHIQRTTYRGSPASLPSPPRPAAPCRAAHAPAAASCCGATSTTTS